MNSFDEIMVDYLEESLQLEYSLSSILIEEELNLEKEKKDEKEKGPGIISQTISAVGKGIKWIIDKIVSIIKFIGKAILGIFNKILSFGVKTKIDPNKEYNVPAKNAKVITNEMRNIMLPQTNPNYFENIIKSSTTNRAKEFQNKQEVIIKNFDAALKKGNIKIKGSEFNGHYEEHRRAVGEGKNILSTMEKSLNVIKRNLEKANKGSMNVANATAAISMIGTVTAKYISTTGEMSKVYIEQLGGKKEN